MAHECLFKLLPYQQKCLRLIGLLFCVAFYIFMEKTRTKIEEAIDQFKSDREKLFQTGFPIIVKFEQEGRSFFTTIAMVIGAILAFSFVPLQSGSLEGIRHINMFTAGQVLLFIDVAVAIYCSFSSWKKHLIGFYQVYNEELCKINFILNIFFKKNSGQELTGDDLKAILVEFQKKSLHELKAMPESFALQWAVVLLSIIGIGALAFSFLPIGWL